MLSVAPQQSVMTPRIELVLTDMVSPDAHTLAGAELQANLQRLRAGGYQVPPPLQSVSAFDVPDSLIQGTAVFLLGSPAGHDPHGGRLKQHSRANNKRFKEQVFYSMCYQTPPSSALVMTYSASACGRMEFWTAPDEDPMRSLMVCPAWFQRYQPRLGLADSLGALADAPDTMVAMYIPASRAAKLAWNNERLDVAATIRGWLGVGQRLVTFGCYTAELEADIMGVAELQDYSQAHGDANTSIKRRILD